VQTWDGLRLGLLAHGYRLVQFWQLSCAAHDDHRVATEAAPNLYPCPVCQRPCKAVFLAEGYTRRQLPFIEQTLTPLPVAFRKLLLAKEQQPWRPKGAGRPRVRQAIGSVS
jgi:hypothetical protein